MIDLVDELRLSVIDFAEDVRWWLGLAYLAVLCFILWFALGGPLDLLDGPEDDREKS